MEKNGKNCKIDHSNDEWRRDNDTAKVKIIQTNTQIFKIEETEVPELTANGYWEKQTDSEEEQFVEQHYSSSI